MKGRKPWLVGLMLLLLIGGYTLSRNNPTPERDVPSVEVRFQNSSGEPTIEFTLTVKGTSFTYTLEGNAGSFSELPEGVLLYSYDVQRRRSEYLMVDHDGRTLWRKSFDRLVKFLDYQGGSVILAESENETSERTTVYIIEAATGKGRELSIGERAFHVSDALMTGGTVYVAGASLFSGEVVVYVFEGGSPRRILIDSIGDRLVGVKVLLDSDGKRLAVTYSIDSWSGDYRRGLCVFRLPQMKLEGRFDLPPGMLQDIELHDGLLTVKTEEEERTYGLG